MTPEQLERHAREVEAIGGKTVLEVPHLTVMPKGFPRGELLVERETSSVRAYCPTKVLKWMKINHLLAEQN